MNKPKNSVIVPVYNVEKYLKECLDSLVNQTLQDFGIICINNGSTDGSLNILKEYAQKDKRIKIINQENKGLSAARNCGIEVATGEYIGFIDSDDYVDINFYENLYKRGKETDSDIVVCEYMCRFKDKDKKFVKLGHAKFFNQTDYILSKEYKHKINIVFAVDDNYIQQCAVAMVSILANSNYENFYEFYILNTGLKEKNIEKLNSLKTIRNFNINYIDVSKYDLSQFPLNRDWISAATYYRLFIADVLPKSIKKCIYMDCDMIAEDDLAILWNYDISGYYAGVVEDENSKVNIERLNLPQESNYFNAGMIVFNLEKIREIDLLNVSIGYYNKNKEKITLQDQDILNGIFNDRCLFLPLRWNVGTTMYLNHASLQYNSYLEGSAACNPGIIHFTGGDKPWNISSTHPLRHEYFKYLQLTNFTKDIKKYKLHRIWGTIIYYNKLILKYIFSIKNSDNKYHKIITILGIKIKIKRKCKTAKGQM